MGNDQSSRSKDQEIRQLLNEQRMIYEQRCQQYVDRASAEGARSAQATRSPPQAAAPAQPSAPPAPAQPPLPAQSMLPPQVVYVPQPAFNPQPAYMQEAAQGAASLGYNLERQPAPYSNAREELLSMRGNPSTAPNLYPNLRHQALRNQNSNPAQGFVFVNNSGQAESTRPPAPRTSNRDRSVSRSRNNNSGIDSELKCPTCKKVYTLQIFQCNQGHSSCSACKGQNRQCGICGNQITTMRNFTLEEYIAEKKVPCPHKDDGCQLYIKLSEIDIHAKECPFKEIQCPLGCGWKGSLKQLSGHFDVLHPHQRMAKIDSEIRLPNISNNSENVYLVVIGAFHFLFHVKVSEPNGKIYMTVQLIGTKFSAQKWSYEIHVYNKNQPRRKCMFTDSCSSYVESVTDIYKQNKCSVLPVQYASTFVHNGALTYKLFIKKIIDDKPRAPRGDFVKNQRGKGRK